MLSKKKRTTALTSPVAPSVSVIPPPFLVRTGRKKTGGAVLSIFAFAHGLIFILRIADMIRLDLGARMVLGWFFRWVVALSSSLLECKNTTAWDGKIDGKKSNHPNINGCHVSFDVAQSKKTCPAIDIVNILEMLVLPASAYLRECSCSQYTGEIATLLCSFTSGPLCICMFFAWHLYLLGKRDENLELRSPPRARSNASTSAPAEKFQLLFTYWKRGWLLNFYIWAFWP